MEQFVIRRYEGPPVRAVGRPRMDDAARRARYYLRPPAIDESTPKRRRESERALREWRRTPIPGAVKVPELIRWLWEDGERVCPLCERDIDLTIAPRTHPGKAELDHVLSKALGGSHVWGNVRVAHGTCNRLRGAHDGVGADYSVKQYRRVFDRALEAHHMVDRNQAKSRMRIAGTVDSYQRRIERFEEMLGWFGDPKAEARMSDYFRQGGPERVREAIAFNKREMEPFARMLNALDWMIVGTNANRALREERERRALNA